MRLLIAAILSMVLYAYLTEGERGIRTYDIKAKMWTINTVF